jgi:hypothetical protein
MFNLGLLVLDWIGPIIRCLSLKPRSDPLKREHAAPAASIVAGELVG